jgi:hypothetical protein
MRRKFRGKSRGHRRKGRSKRLISYGLGRGGHRMS